MAIKNDRQSLVVIDDGMLRVLITDSRFQQLLPCLRNADIALTTVNPSIPGCVRCKRKKAKIVASAMAEARRCVAGARGTRLSQLKSLLNAKQIRIHSPNAAGRIIKFTI